jgi:hypothetical protein
MTKNFMQDGKWTDNPREPKVILCACGSKYIKTRPNQSVCLSCVSREKEAARQ